MKNVQGLVGMVTGEITSEDVVSPSQPSQRRVLKGHSCLLQMERTFRIKGLRIGSVAVVLLLGSRRPHLNMEMAMKLTRMRYCIPFTPIYESLPQWSSGSMLAIVLKVQTQLRLIDF
jgi:hypothetical protein